MKKYLLASVLSLTAWTAMADVVVTDGYVRAVPEGQLNSAAFMLLENTADEDLALVAASSDVANTVELHTHQNDNGTMRMRQIDQIDLPAHQQVKLQPGGLHVMLIGLKQTLEADQQVAVSLRFSDGSEQQLNLPVKNITQTMHKHEHKHAHGDKAAAQ